MPMTSDEIITCIQNALPDAIIDMHDLAGDNDHWSAVVQSTAFAGKTRVAQHKMVMDAINASGKDLHALQLKTKTL